MAASVRRAAADLTARHSDRSGKQEQHLRSAGCVLASFALSAPACEKNLKKHLTNPLKYGKIKKPHVPGSYKCIWMPPDTASSTKRQVPKMYAVIETGGKQVRVQEGDIVFIEKLDAEAGAAVTFDKVVAVGTEEGIKVGVPYVEGAAVTAKVLKNGKGKKITVFTYKPKKGQKRKMGHRQPYTQVQIGSIQA